MKNIIKSFRKRDYLFLVLILLFVVVQVIGELSLPEYSGKIVEYIQLSKSVSDIWVVGKKMILITLSTAVSAAIVGYFASKLSSAVGASLRKKVFEKTNSFSMQEINKFSVASLITRTTNDITQIQTTMAIFLKLAVYAPILSSYALIKIADKSSTLTLATTFAILGVVILISFMVLFVVPRYKKIQTKIDKINLITRENLTGLKVIRANNAENIQLNKFETANEDLTKDTLFVTRMASVMQPGMYFILNILSLAIVWLGAHLICDGQLLFKDMTVFTQYSIQVLIGFIILSMLFTMLPRAIVSTKRINEILNTKNQIISGNKSPRNKNFTTVEFKDVCFKYPDSEEYVLKNINLSAQSGEVVAFIGSTGSGKSTLINLIPRFYDVTSGEILVNNINIKEYTSENLNNKIGYVPQKSTLFGGTIKENIRYGKNNASIKEINNALAIAQATNFVNRLDGGIDYYISQSAKNISGGQKQRLQIARAVVKNPNIFIFDDSFSALDYKTDQKLRRALKPQLKSSIAFIVAQRVGTIMDADKIVVLDNGKMVGMGTHKELLETCSVYKQIVYSQLSKDEIGN